MEAKVLPIGCAKLIFAKNHARYFGGLFVSAPLLGDFVFVPVAEQRFFNIPD